MEGTHRILVIGAHPDDADTSCAGLLSKLIDAGWEAKLISVTDGGAGTYRTDLSREELADHAQADEWVQKAVARAGGEVRKVIAVPNKLVNLIVK